MLPSRVTSVQQSEHSAKDLYQVPWPGKEVLHWGKEKILLNAGQMALLLVVLVRGDIILAAKSSLVRKSLVFQSLSEISARTVNSYRCLIHFYMRKVWFGNLRKYLPFCGVRLQWRDPLSTVLSGSGFFRAQSFLEKGPEASSCPSGTVPILTTAGFQAAVPKLACLGSCWGSSSVRALSWEVQVLGSGDGHRGCRWEMASIARSHALLHRGALTDATLVPSALCAPAGRSECSAGPCQRGHRSRLSVLCPCPLACLLSDVILPHRFGRGDLGWCHYRNGILN